MKTIITIGRQYGSAGHSIGKILADDLGIKYYDKELLERAAKDMNTKKQQPQMRPPTMCWNTFGRVINSRDGPASGCTP